MRVVLFFTFDISLELWAKTGLLHREVRIYQELIRLYNIEVQFITYGGESDKKWSESLGDIQLLPVYTRMTKRQNKFLNILQSVLIPWFFRNELKNSDVLKTNQIWGGCVAVISKWVFNKPLIARCGNEFYDFSKKQNGSRKFLIFAYFVSKLTYSQADCIHVASTRDKRLVHEVFKIPHKRIDVRSNWIESKIFYQMNNKRSTNKVLFVGRLTPQKNLSILIDALKVSDISVDVLGHGELYSEIKDQIKKNNVNVKFLKTIPNNKMAELYNHYAVYVMCSNYEGNPKTLLEAMSCGCAVVGTDVSGIREIIQHEKTGLLVSKDSEMLRDAILRLISSDKLRESLGDAASSYILKHNSFNSALENEFKSYKKLTDS